MRRIFNENRARLEITLGDLKGIFDLPEPAICVNELLFSGKQKERTERGGQQEQNHSACEWYQRKSG